MSAAEVMSDLLVLAGVFVVSALTMTCVALAVFPLLVFDAGAFGRMALDSLLEEIRRQCGDESPRWDLKELEALSRLHRLIEDAENNHRSAADLAERAIAALVGRPDDRRFIAQLASRRAGLQVDEMLRLDQLVAEASSVGALVRAAPGWYCAARRRLKLRGLLEAGSQVVEAIATEGGSGTGKSGVLGAALAMMLWVLGNAVGFHAVSPWLLVTIGITGGFVGGYGRLLISRHRSVICVILQAQPARPAGLFRLTAGAVPALSGVFGVVTYLGLFTSYERWVTRLLNGVRVPDAVGMAVVYCLLNAVLGRATWLSVREWRAKDLIVTWQRLSSLAMGLFGLGMLLGFDGAGVVLLGAGQGFLLIVGYGFWAFVGAASAVFLAARFVRRRTVGRSVRGQRPQLRVVQ